MSNRLSIRAASVLVTLAALAGLSACSPADKPVIAVSEIDGQPTLVLAECAAFTPTRISVFTRGATPATNWTIYRDGGEKLTAVTMLQPPLGWAIDTDSPLVAFQADVQYSVVAYGIEHNSRTVDFTLDEVTRLGVKQVLVGSGDDRKAVTETAFRDKAKKAC
ncbi:hypothetical protein LADH09A_005119 [Micromonospora sp. LAH09]|uniref:hypothetical protein n=1 Tax=Micromonospora cabrerizensis TaxID=2911213 RepID=UPI001EE81330|nr:hypothetical protein [Micromonospora cabrerizensis]MCG5471141.1 hypothetical protein [Micromonospora cabrerizensis]